MAKASAAVENRRYGICVALHQTLTQHEPCILPRCSFGLWLDTHTIKVKPIRETGYYRSTGYYELQ
jgi:hypothetical protein